MGEFFNFFMFKEAILSKLSVDGVLSDEDYGPEDYNLLRKLKALGMVVIIEGEFDKIFAVKKTKKFNLNLAKRILR